MSKLPATAIDRAYAPVYEGWGTDRKVSDYRDTEFVDSAPLFHDIEEARRYARNNTGNFPYCTTGEVALVEVTVKPIKIES
jgi:hypothetical protein